MVYDRSKPLTKKNLINFLRSLNIDVRTNTKARGNQGIYQKNRIDIARGLNDEKAIKVLIHEFAHHIHFNIDKDFVLNGGSLETLFNVKNADDIKKELINFLQTVDINSRLKILIEARRETSKKIKDMQNAIKHEYPNFLRSKNFTEFDKYIKTSEAGYLVKHDAVKISHGFFFVKERILTVKNIEADFPDMPKPFKTYIKLCSMRRKQSKISRRINKFNKYYRQPAELFARFVQEYFFNQKLSAELAPVAVKRFSELLDGGYYRELKDLFEIFKC